jgi:hypothetical protein
MSSLIDVATGNDLTSDQEKFVNVWSKEYFDHVAVSRDLKKASVHWRLFLTVDGELTGHVALTEFMVIIDGREQSCGAVGGLLTARTKMGKGYGNQLMDAAETFIFERLAFESAILFCLPDLVPFYGHRGWTTIQTPVTLEQSAGIITWPESVMTLRGQPVISADSIIHVPKQPQKNQRS